MSPLGKNYEEEEIICSCLNWTQSEALADSGPDKSHARQNPIAAISGGAEHSAFVSCPEVRNKTIWRKLSGWLSADRSSEEQSDGWQYQTWPWSISELAKCWKRCGRFRSFPNCDPLMPSLSSSLSFSPLHPPTFPAGQHEGRRVVLLLLKPGYQRPWLTHRPVLVEYLTLLIINSVLCKG